MKLITEEVSQVKFITEGKGSQKKLYIEGVFLQGDICNRNGRMYPMETLSREVKRYTESFINKGRALGELGHPDGPTVNLDRVSHKIVSLTQEGSNFRGKAQLLETPMGKIAKSLIDEGVCLGVSSRGVGSLRMTNEGHKVVGEDFKLLKKIKYKKLKKFCYQLKKAIAGFFKKSVTSINFFSLCWQEGGGGLREKQFCRKKVS